MMRQFDRGVLFFLLSGRAVGPGLFASLPRRLTKQAAADFSPRGGTGLPRRLSQRAAAGFLLRDRTGRPSRLSGVAGLAGPARLLPALLVVAGVVISLSACASLSAGPESASTADAHTANSHTTSGQNAPDQADRPPADPPDQSARSSSAASRAKRPPSGMGGKIHRRKARTARGGSGRPSALPAGRAGAAGQTELLKPVEELWKAGFQNEARRLFWSRNIRALAHGKHADEWSFWRSRLFTEHWDASLMGLSGENISALYVDNDDVWAGTWTGGISRLSEPLGEVSLRDAGEPSLAVRTVNRILRHGSRIWVVRYGAVEYYKLRDSSWGRLEGLPASERLQDLCFCRNTMYLATLGSGLWKQTPGGWVRLNEPGLFINRLAVNSRDEILVSTMDRGLFVHDPAQQSWQRSASSRLKLANVTAAADNGSVIVGGTYGEGAFVWKRKSDAVRFFDADTLGDAWVLDVAISGNWVYFATFGAGLNAWNMKSGKWERFSIRDGFPTGDVASLAKDGRQRIWAGTLGGGIMSLERGIHGE